MSQPALYPAATTASSSQPLPKGHCPPADTHSELMGWGADGADTATAPRCSWFQGRTEPWGGHAKHPGGYGSSHLVSPARGTSAPLPGHGAVAQRGQTHE